MTTGQQALGERAHLAVTTQMTVNGRSHTLQVEPWTSLLDLLREGLQLTGSKKGCDHGQCGACTVLLNGVRVNSCLCLAVMHDGDEVTTIAGEALGLPLAKVIVKLGDSELPVAPLEGGSWTVSSVGTAVTEACKAVAERSSSSPPVSTIRP